MSPVVCVYRSKGAGLPNGVRDHGDQLAAALMRAGHTASVVDLHGTTGAAATLRTVSAAAGPHSWILLQYVPHAFARRGVAPGLPWWLAALRRRRPDLRIATLVHEPYVRFERPQDLLLSPAMRLQLAAVCALSDTVLATTETWARMVRPLARAAVQTLPVGSNLPDRRAARASTRNELGADEDTLVLSAFATGAATTDREAVRLAAAAAAGRAGGALFLNLGAGAPEVGDLGADVRVVAPGMVDAGDLAGLLAASDVLLAPFVDGVSARRTTVVAALQHAVPTVTTVGWGTDGFLRDSRGLELVSVGDRRAFADATEGLARSAERRGRAARAARCLFDERFSWPVIGARFLSALAEAERAPAAGRRLRPGGSPSHPR